MAMHAEREHTKHAEPHGRVVDLAGVGNREPADAVGRDPYSLHDGEGRRESALALRTGTTTSALHSSRSAIITRPWELRDEAADLVLALSSLRT